MKKACILMGSPRKDGNTSALVKPFELELEALGFCCSTVNLYEKELKPCIACRSCQSTWSSFGCSLKDDMGYIFDCILSSDLLVIASPVYSWYCTPPAKAVLDRMVYGMNKFYGEKRGPSLWAGKHVAVITTCGYSVEKGADLLEEGIKRYCRHSGLNYIGMLAERHLGYDTVFMDSKKELHSREFARKAASCISDSLLSAQGDSK